MTPSTTPASSVATTHGTHDLKTAGRASTTAATETPSLAQRSSRSTLCTLRPRSLSPRARGRSGSVRIGERERPFAQPRGRRRQGPREYRLAEHWVFGAKRVARPYRVPGASTTMRSHVPICCANSILLWVISLYHRNFSRQLRKSGNYNGLTLPGILTRRYFFMAIFQFLLCRV